MHLKKTGPRSHFRFWMLYLYSTVDLGLVSNFISSSILPPPKKSGAPKHINKNNRELHNKGPVILCSCLILCFLLYGVSPLQYKLHRRRASESTYTSDLLQPQALCSQTDSVLFCNFRQHILSRGSLLQTATPRRYSMRSSHQVLSRLLKRKKMP